MFKPTRFTERMLYFGLALIREEAAIVHIDNSTDEMPRHGAQHFHMQQMPSTQRLEAFMKEHHLKIDIPGMRAQEVASETTAPLPTPGMKQAGQAKSQNIRS